ncbi:FAD-dependent oxidoreductase [Sodalis sp. (in: enterobacteria)]|uniref:glycerol-3-phosphate dehydrogenase/oxidase n=1 Tax=Sodalis sp. (in: enterobacteria) TaxID=1898979 RepID=UPI003F39DEBD
MAEHDREPLLGRETQLAALRARDRVPVLIVGGGINGISTFRELALQGIPAIIVEQGDWCQAASGALSRMIHGGLRYLETGEFGLVKESVTERDRLLLNAPHYVAPLRTTVPIDSWGGGLVNAGKRFLRLGEKPARRGALIIKTGLTLYDLYTRQSGTMPRHQLNGLGATRRRWPGFAPWIRCSATYYDAWITAPERLGVELLEDSRRANPQALALNYLSVEGTDGVQLTLRDALSQETFTLRPHIVVNATGAWVDALNGMLAPERAGQKMIGGTKGSHLIVRSPELLRMLGDEMVYYENHEGRVCIMFPWFGNVLVGSTDIRIDDPDEAVCDEAEKRYILESLNFVFPSLRVGEDDVLYTFSGVRPLPASDAALNGRISRNHSLALLPPVNGREFATLCLIGGKWTTFRAFGEQAADRVLHLLGEKRQVGTQHLAIAGGRDYPAAEQYATWLRQLTAQSGLPSTRVAQLAARYGTRAEAIIAAIGRRPDRPLRHHADYSENEIADLIHHEQAVMPEDVLVRRTRIAISGEATLARVTELATLMARELGWSDDLLAQNIALTCSRLASRHGLANLTSSADTEETRYADHP